MDEHYYAVIMAGGGGTRLWPLSRRGQPKQMLRLGGERTLFQRAVDRLEGVIPPERTLVVGWIVRERLLPVEASNPVPRPLALAALHAHALDIAVHLVHHATAGRSASLEASQASGGKLNHDPVERALLAVDVDVSMRKTVIR